MSEQERETDDDDARGDAVESAGETTAADTVTGPSNEKPVGEDTEVKVEAREE
ncbi:MAG TPA: hypothetical protein VM914_01035 [Pyrinomonadaceae bacterium]|jgi:hypothetical protein|nr:hypothetical protein [Pyrinomonadaceae bacterium]